MISSFLYSDHTEIEKYELNFIVLRATIGITISDFQLITMSASKRPQSFIVIRVKNSQNIPNVANTSVCIQFSFKHMWSLPDVFLLWCNMLKNYLFRCFIQIYSCIYKYRIHGNKNNLKTLMYWYTNDTKCKGQLATSTLKLSHKTSNWRCKWVFLWALDVLSCNMNIYS